MKLSTLKPVLSSTPKKKNRRKVEPGREWYNTQEWKELRIRIFIRDKYTCQYKGCGKLEIDSSKLVAHHKIKHKGNYNLFWDEENITTVCKPCHDGPIAAEERKNDLWGTWY